MNKILGVMFFIAGTLPASEYHVAPSGQDSYPGSAAKPLRTISAAAHLANPGDTVTVHAGIYREQVNPPRGGTSNERRIVYQTAPGEQVTVSGAEIVADWQKVANDTWKVVLSNTFFGDFNPYSDVISGEWYIQRGFPHHTGAVYLNGDWLTEARHLKQVLQPVGRRQLWKAEVDAEKTTIYAQFKGVDPNRGQVEINVRQSVFYPDAPRRNYITVRGFNLTKAATPWAGAMSEQAGLIGTHWSKGWIIENNTISYSMNSGITLGRYDLSRFGQKKPKADAPGFVISCELALKYGWSKETIGGHIVRGNHISHCEKCGIHGSLGGVFSLIENNTIHDIAINGWIGGPDLAGLKLLGSVDTIIRNNHIYRCRGSGGIWLDWMAQGTRVTGNLLHDNKKWDLFTEVNHGPFLIDNNLFLSSHPLQEGAEGGAYVHNLFNGSLKLTPQTRKTPYFDPHSLKNMRLAAFTNEDERFFNNIFAKGSGLAVYKGRKAQIDAAGNLYLAGGAPLRTDEPGALADAEFNPGIKLKEKSDGWWLEMQVNPKWTSAVKRKIITGDDLGRVLTPDAPFVHHDGSPYRIDTDFLGRKRSLTNPAPGPFALGKHKNQNLKIRIRP
jgi:alpha-N-arabinofuranosidase